MSKEEKKDKQEEKRARKAELKALREKLTSQQQEIRAKKLPVIVLVEGWATAGKGNLLFHMRGKQAFSFYNRQTGKSCRIVQKPGPSGLTREESMEYYRTCADEDMFDICDTRIELPEEAKIFESYVCDCCGEKTGANWIRVLHGKHVCLDCFGEYDRLNV